MAIEVKVPNIGDFAGVEVVEVLVKPGDRIVREAPLITLESDKASMDIPAPEAGQVQDVQVKVGDRVSEGDLILLMEPQPDAAGADEPAKNPAMAPEQQAPPDAAPAGADSECELLVLGAGPGGYTAAFRAADLGLETILVERYPTLGGVCLNVGCIPSKALLHAARVISEAGEMKEFGVSFGKPKIDLEKLRDWKNGVVAQLSSGLAGLARQRKVRVVRGTGRFAGANTMDVETDKGTHRIRFDKAIVAAGSQSSRLPGFPDDPRIMDSTGALELKEIPGSLLVVGGGIIGLEMATVYSELGSKVTVVEMLDRLIAGADADIVRPLQKRIEKRYQGIYLGTRVTGVSADAKGFTVQFDGEKAPASARFDRVLVAVGRTPNGNRIGADKAGIQVDERGFIGVDGQQRTNVPHIFAIGDITGQPMLAHKATHQGKVAAEVAAGHKSGFDVQVIPSVAYTDPEVAWAGVTEAEAKARGINYGKGIFPWAASGRALGLGRSEGLSKLLFDGESGRIIGAGIVGANAGDLIAEVALAIEMGADAVDLSLTVHPHPTLSETLAFAAEMYEGTITDLYNPRKK